MAMSTVFNYPNPVHGNVTTFRAQLGEAHRWQIDIFTLSGARIARLTDENAHQFTYNEIPWNTSKVGNGVYLARVEAEGPNGKKTAKIVKVMVVH